MKNDDLMYIVNDPDLLGPDAARAVIQLAREAARSDEDIAGDVVIALTEKLRPGGALRERLGTHATGASLPSGFERRSGRLGQRRQVQAGNSANR